MLNLTSNNLMSDIDLKIKTVYILINLLNFIKQKMLLCFI